MGAALLLCAFVGTMSSSVYLALAVVAARRFRRRSRLAAAATRGERPSAGWPPVTILKPLHGDEPRLEECLESFFALQYPDFDLVFAARDAADGAWPIVARLQARYPHVRTSILHTGAPRYANAKVSALARMLDASSSPHLIIADSDARVPPDCAAAVVRPLLDPGVGLVTCLYRGTPIGGVASQLEALGMSVELTAGVLVADMLEGMKFALGPLMATRRDVLDLVGGMASLGEYCADDYVLGARTAAAGKRVVLSDLVIDHVVVNRTLWGSLRHQARWMRSTRFSRPKGHVGTGLTFAVPFGLLGLFGGIAAHRPGLAAALLGWAVLNRMLLSVAVGWGVVGDPQAWRRCWLYPFRDLLGFGIWCASFAGADIVWRDDRYTLEPGGLMRVVSRGDVPGIR